MVIRIPTIRLAPRRSPQTGDYVFSSGKRVSGPLISCLMVTRGGRFPAAFAIECFQRQSWENRELVIVCDRPDTDVEALVSAIDDPSIRFIKTGHATLGELRNTSVSHARGELLCQWDDDDLYHPQRLELMAGALLEHGVVAVFLQRWMIWWPARRMLATSGSRTWEGSMLVDRAILPTYPAQALAEDNITIARLCSLHPTVLIDCPAMYCYVVHGANSYEDRHFETMLSWASTTVADADYDGALAGLAPALPLMEYAGHLAGGGTR